MLPFQRNHFRIALFPEKVTILRLQKGIQPRVLERLELPCAMYDESFRWKQPLTALQGWLESSKLKKETASIIVSNHFIRYAMLPWSDALTTQEEVQTFARLHFEKGLGEATDQCSIKVCETGFGLPLVASAMDASFIEQLKNLCRNSSMQLVSIQPYLMFAFNQWVRQHGQKKIATSLFLLFEPGKVSAVVVQATKIASVKSYPIFEAQETSKVVRRLLASEGLGSETNIYVSGLDKDGEKMLHDEGFGQATLSIQPPNAEQVGPRGLFSILGRGRK